MKRILYIAFLALAVGNLIAQNKQNAADTSEQFPVEILTRIELNSVQLNIPTIVRNKIYITEKSGKISCFDSTGTVVWQRQITSKINSTPIIADGQIAVGTSNSEIITLGTSDGRQIQSIGIDDSITTNLTATEYKGGKELFMPKQSSSKTAIIFGTSSGNIFCMDLETLQEYWRNNDSPGMIISQPIIVENKILFSGSDGYLYSIDSRNGLLNWRWKETAKTDFSNSKIISDGKKVFAVSEDFHLYCLDLLLGKLIWKLDNIKVQKSVALSKNGKDLFVKTFDRRFLIISANKGKVVKQIKHNTESDSASINPIEKNGKVYITYETSIFTLDKKYKEEVILKFDTAINSLQLIGSNKFLVSTANGTILVFRPRK